ncbi:MAG: LCP family protein required for cell wall assembly [Candidatus Poriferisodalaceae bacterium]|jgi:LCP family protein required for cell wall assembly
MPSDDTWSRLRDLETELTGDGPPQPGLKGTTAAARAITQPPATPQKDPTAPPGSKSEPRIKRQRTPRGTKSGPRRLVRPAVVILLIVIILGIAGFGYGRWRLGQIERVDLDEVLAPVSAGGPTWLVVGSDSREGIDPNRPDAGGLLGEVVAGQRADAIILVRDIPGQGIRMLSLPRDLWIDPAGPDNAGRINAALNRGAADLVELISIQLGIPIHHYAEVDLAGLDDVVDAVGGVTLDIPYPGYDDSLGLRIGQAGPVTLDGATALAYVRTRRWVELIDGVETPDGTGDLGRTLRQQGFLRALGAKVASLRNPLAVNSAMSGIADSVRLDGGAGMGDLIGFARMIQNAEQAEPLPVRGHVTDGGASVLVMEPGAETILDLYR